MKLEISTPDKILFDGEVSAVQCPGKDGLFQVLDNHAPMIAILKGGHVKYETADSATSHFIDIRRGVMQVLNNKVIVLSE
jgi:F-type H+-transporting ATPase subunit epsilon